MVLTLAIGHVLLASWLHWGRSWQGDEWGSVLALSEDYGTLLSRFGDWYTMNFYLAGLKLLHSVGASNWGLVTPSLASGFALVLLTAGIVHSLGGSTAAVRWAALLAATNPYLLTYSVTIRSYAITAALLAGALLLLLHWRERAGWARALAFALCANAAILMNLNALYPLLALAVLALVWAWRDPSLRARLLQLVAPSAALLVLVVLAYWGQLDDIRKFRSTWSDTPPVSLTFLPELFARYFGRGWLALPAIAALMVSGWRLIARAEPGQVLLLLVILAVAAISLAGVSHYPHAYARFLIGVLPWLLAAIALGCTALPVRRVGWVLLSAVVVVGLITFAAERRFQHDRPWREMAEHIHAMVGGGKAHAVVLGNEALVSALQVHGAEARAGFAAVLQSLPPEERATVLLLDVTGGFDATPVLQLGVLRLYRFEGAPRQMAQQFLAGPVQSSGERARPELTALYYQAARVFRWLERNPEANRFEILRHRCALLEERTRTRPAQMVRPEQ